MLRAIASRFSHTIANDIAAAEGQTTENGDPVHRYDASCGDLYRWARPDVIFNLSGEIAWECIKPALLCLPRISFTGGGTDSGPLLVDVVGGRGKARRPRGHRERASGPLCLLMGWAGDALRQLGALPRIILTERYGARAGVSYK